MSQEGVTLSFRPLDGIGYAIGVLGLEDRSWRTTSVRLSEAKLPNELMTTRRVVIPEDWLAGENWWMKHVTELAEAPRVGLTELRRLLDESSHGALHSILMRPYGTMGIVRAQRVSSFQTKGRKHQIRFADAANAEHVLQCVFPALSQWRWTDQNLELADQTRHDSDVIADLNDMETYFVVTKMDATTSPTWAITGIWGLRRVAMTDVRPLRKLLRRKLLSRWQPECIPESAGVRICWHCGKVSESYVDRTNNRHTYRCGHCHYPIGKSASY